MSGQRKMHAIYLGESMKDLSESMHEGFSSAKEKISFGNLFQLKPARNLFDKLLDLLEEKTAQRHVDREVIISKIDVKPIFDEFLEECSKITTVSDKLREKIESRSEKIASALNDILEKTSELKPNIKDRVDTMVEKIGSNKPNFEKISPKNHLSNFSGPRKIHAIHLGECLKDILETIHDGLSSAKDRISFGNIFQLKPARNMFEKLLDLLKEKAIERQSRREVVISKIDVKPIFDEFLDECGKVVTITDKLRDKVDSRMETLASSMTDILVKTSELKPNIKDRMDSIADKIGSNKPNFDNIKILPNKKYDEEDIDHFDHEDWMIGIGKEHMNVNEGLHRTQIVPFCRIKINSQKPFHRLFPLIS